MANDITGIGSIFDFGSKVLDKIFPDKAQADAAKLAMFQAQQAGEFKSLDQDFELMKAQIGVNAVEAQSPRLFVSGGRPFLIWIGGVAFAYAVIVEPLMRFITTVAFHYPGPFPAIDTTLTLQILLGVLGLSGLRTSEKFKGVASK